MNLFDLSGSETDSERFDTLLTQAGVTVERIVSWGQATPEGQWYDQNWDEWVLVVSGMAGLLFSDAPDLIELKPGDSLFLPAHRKHRVVWTDPDNPTIWLAIHLQQPEKSCPLPPE